MPSRPIRDRVARALGLNPDAPRLIESLDRAVERAQSEAATLRRRMVAEASKRGEQWVADDPAKNYVNESVPVVPVRATARNVVEMRTAERSGSDGYLREIEAVGDVVMRRAQIQTMGSAANVPETLTDDEWAERQGTVGTPFAGQLPAVEARRDYQPYAFRGFNYQHGEAQRFYRGSAAVQDAIEASVDYLAGATWEFEAPEVDPDLVRRLGGDPDEIARKADELNAELIANPWVNLHDIIAEQYRNGRVAGFAIHEWGADWNQQPGRRLLFVETRDPSSMEGWVYDRAMTPLAVVQSDPNGLGWGRGRMRPTMDLRKCLYHAQRRTGANFEGLSVLRSVMTEARMYTEFVKSAIQARQRWATGFIEIRGIRSDDTSAAGMDAAIDLMASFVASAKNAVITNPAGFGVHMHQPPSDTELIGVLEWLISRFRQACGAQMFDIGSGDTGSFAASKQQAELFERRIRGQAKPIEDAFSSLARAYVMHTPGAPDLPIMPVMKVRNLVVRDPSSAIELIAKVSEMERQGAELGDLNAARELAGLPHREAEPVDGDDVVQDVREPLNGAQALSAADIAERLAAGTMGRTFAMELLLGLGFDAARAERMVDETIAGVRAGTISPPADAAPRSVPAKYEGIDLVPTKGMRDAARNGIERHERGETGDGIKPETIRRANQIADGETMTPDHWREMRAWFARHGADGAGDPGSPEYASWQLWGGDAGESRSDTVAGQLDRADEDAEPRAVATPTACACGQCDAEPVTRARGPEISSMTRGGEFVTFRELTPTETLINLPGIEDRADRTQDRIDRAIERVQRQHRASYVEQSRALMDPPRPDLLASLRPDFTDQYADAIRGHLRPLAEFVRADMVDEIAAQLGESSPVQQDNDKGALPEQAIEGAILTLATRVNARMNDRLTAAAQNVAAGGKPSTLSRLAVGAGFVTALGVAQAVSTVINETRDQVAQDGPRVMRATYSAVMDRLTCPTCAAYDGSVYRYPSAAYERAKPPNPNCRGFIGPGQGQANPCRCVMVYEFTDAPPPDTRAARPDGDPSRTVTLVVGPPTSGKSTAAASLDVDEVIDVDDLIFADGGAWSAESSTAAHAAALERLSECIADGRSVAYVAPLMTHAVRAKVAEMIAGMDGGDAYEVQILGCDVDEETAIQRNADRPPERQINPSALRAMLTSYERPG